LIFVEGGKPESQEKNPCDKEENQQTTQLTWSTQAEDRTMTHWDHSGERRAYYPNATHASNTFET
jgi:hypothetical protein